jgi:hypothetical protein
MKNLLLAFILVFNSVHLFAQDDLEALLNDGAPLETEYAKYAFKSTRIINSHSIENVARGVLDFRILHRFGSVNGGAYQLFGLDQANVRFSFDYGISNRLMVGIGRSNVGKEYDSYVKYKILRQSTGKVNMPISITYAAGVVAGTLKWTDATLPEPPLGYRVTYYHQLLVARKFSEALTLQLTPTVLHRNWVNSNTDPNDIYALGIGGRVKINNRLATTFDYWMVPGNQLPNYNNTLSVGFDIETGGHVFQLHFTNNRGMNEKQFITEGNGQWLKGDIQFGFNLSRVFTIR